MQCKQPHAYGIHRPLKLASTPAFEGIVMGRIIILLCPICNNSGDYLIACFAVYLILLDDRPIRVFRICLHPYNIC
jgi:hypothetical protein